MLYYRILSEQEITPNFPELFILLMYMAYANEKTPNYSIFADNYLELTQQTMDSNVLEK